MYNTIQQYNMLLSPFMFSTKQYRNYKLHIKPIITSPLNQRHPNTIPRHINTVL